MSEPTTPTPPPVMQLHDVSFAYYKGEPVIDGVTADVQPGMVHALIGPNAAGKSTLLRLMLGELVPSAGRVMIGGVSVRRLTPKIRARLISYVPQRASVSFSYSVAEVVRMGRFAVGEDDTAVDAALRACELDDLRHRPFDELSAGQQQRVLLARALAQSSGGGGGRIMLLDEPTSALDLAHIHRTMTHLRRLAAAGLAVVTVLHDLNLAARYADQIWLLHQGRLAAAGPWHQVLTPQLLEPIYHVKLHPVGQTPDTRNPRPIFQASI